MEYFNESHVDRFEALFLKKVDDVKLRYDNFVHFARIIPKLLKQGLTNRVNLIAVNYNKLPSWSTSEQPKTYISSNINLYVGFIFNPDESNRLVDYGPSPEDA